MQKNTRVYHQIFGYGITIEQSNINVCKVKFDSLATSRHIHISKLQKA